MSSMAGTLSKSPPGLGQFLNLQPFICGWVSTSERIQVLNRGCTCNQSPISPSEYIPFRRHTYSLLAYYYAFDFTKLRTLILIPSKSSTFGMVFRFCTPNCFFFQQLFAQFKAHKICSFWENTYSGGIECITSLYLITSLLFIRPWKL